MKYNTLGQSSLSISEIGFGCMSLGHDDAENAKLIHHAIDLGIKFFDTADLYGKGSNEISIGKALKGRWNNVVIASKAGNQWRKDGSGWDWNPRKEYILQCIDKSLERLQTDHIDLSQLHGGTLEDPIDETIEAFEILLKQGKILNYGISSIRPNVIREYVKRSSIISVMTQYSLLDRRPEEGTLDFLQQNNIGVLSRGGLAQGLLVDKPAKEYLGYSDVEVARIALAVRSVSGSQRSPAQAAIQYVLAHPAISSAVIGIRTMDQLKDVAGTSNVVALTSKELNILRQALKPKVYEQHR